MKSFIVLYDCDERRRHQRYVTEMNAVYHQYYLFKKMRRIETAWMLENI